MTMISTVRRTLRAELVKLRTLRSHMWLLAVAVLFMLLLGPIQAIGAMVAPDGSQEIGSDGAVSLALAGASTATLLIGVLGVLLVTGEYAPRAIRTTFTAVPRRGYVVAAKAGAIGLAVTATGAVAVAGAVTASLGILDRAGVDAGWGSPHVLRVSAAMVWYLAGWGVLGVAAGWVTRSKIGGAALLVTVMLVLAPLLGLIPGRAGAVLAELMPSSAGGAMLSTHGSGPLSTPAAGFLLWTGYLVLFTAGSAWVTSRRDA